MKVPKVALLIEGSRASGRGLLRGIAKYAAVHGPWAFFRQPPFYVATGSAQKTLERLAEWRPDGIVARDSPQTDALLELGAPVIISLSRLERYPTTCVSVDAAEQIAAIAAEHLIERGFRNFAFCGFDRTSWSQHRCEHFVEYVRQAGYATHVYHQAATKAGQLWENEQQVMAQWLKGLPQPVGLMACNDERAQNVIDACLAADLRVPDDVAVLGVDNDDLICELTNPQISSVALNDERAGYEIAELLDRLMAGHDVGQRILVTQPTHIVTRQSTNVLAVSDPDVAAALRFMREHARQLIQVDDVLKVVPLSRRSLERRFRKVLGRSVHEEIRRARVHEICRILVETNLPVSQIAMQLGYPGVDHFARAFRKEKHMSPLAYRRHYGRK